VKDGSRIAFVAAKNLGDDVWGFNKEEELSACFILAVKLVLF